MKEEENMGETAITCADRWRWPGAVLLTGDAGGAGDGVAFSTGVGSIGTKHSPSGRLYVAVADLRGLAAVLAWKTTTQNVGMMDLLKKIKKGEKRPSLRRNEHGKKFWIFPHKMFLFAFVFHNGIHLQQCHKQFGPDCIQTSVHFTTDPPTPILMYHCLKINPQFS